MIVTSFDEKRENPVVICLGGFDSIHKGHKFLISVANDLKENLDAKSVVFTYDNELCAINGKSNGLVFTFEERKIRLEKLGVDEICLAHFNYEFANRSPEEFLIKLCENRNVKMFICGKDFKFGKGAKGDFSTLIKFCNEGKIAYKICDFILDSEQKKFSTSTIKEKLSTGDIKKVNDYLGDNYFVLGRVISGRKVGRQLGFPTANIAFSTSKYLPKNGVYATHVIIKGKRYNAITNVGNAPTFNEEKKLIECHVDGFNGNLYDQDLNVYFDFYIRDICKFESVDLLIRQLEKDLTVIR